jgi:hypothetical protein
MNWLLVLLGVVNFTRPCSYITSVEPTIYQKNNTKNLVVISPFQISTLISTVLQEWSMHFLTRSEMILHFLMFETM